MNIFEEYLNKILNKIKLASKEKLILLPESLSGINVDIPPKKFKCDLSTNVAMVLSKILFKYSSKIFILMLYIIVWRTYQSYQKYNQI